jgi:hypothetical protein
MSKDEFLKKSIEYWQPIIEKHEIIVRSARFRELEQQYEACGRAELCCNCSPDFFCQCAILECEREELARNERCLSSLLKAICAKGIGSFKIGTRRLVDFVFLRGWVERHRERDESADADSGMRPPAKLATSRHLATHGRKEARDRS